MTDQRNDDGGRAFPEVFTDFRVDGERHVTYSAGGMSLRDYFAGRELAKVNATSVCDIPEAYSRVADHCYRMADAMLKERAK